MELLQLVGVAFVTAVAAILLKETKPELSFAVAIAGSIILLLLALELLRGSMGVFSEIASLTGVDTALIKTLLKMVGIGYLVEFSAGVLSDFGQNSLADKLVFAGKILILLLAVPIVESVLKLIVQLLGLVQ